MKKVKFLKNFLFERPEDFLEDFQNCLGQMPKFQIWDKGGNLIKENLIGRNFVKFTEKEGDFVRNPHKCIIHKRRVAKKIKKYFRLSK